MMAWGTSGESQVPHHPSASVVTMWWVLGQSIMPVFRQALQRSVSVSRVPFSPIRQWSHTPSLPCKLLQEIIYTDFLGRFGSFLAS
jgi:hypothetical protein